MEKQLQATLEDSQLSGGGDDLKKMFAEKLVTELSIVTVCSKYMGTELSFSANES
jgi:hypothetical protein